MNEVFGPFRLVRLIARGGMAETFEGERTGPAGMVQRVCVKRILQERALDPIWIQLFKKEARIAASLRHANIALLHDFDRERGVWWMSFELVDGVTLRALMTMHKNHGPPMPVDAVVFVASEVAKALAYAHARTALDGSPAAVVHRDVTPTNILVTGDGTVKLVDFGLATVLEKDKTRTGGRGGKAGYMSPEQCYADSAQYPVDHRTDLFSLGVVMFEMLAGTRPFDGRTELETMSFTANGTKKDLRALAPETPEPLAQIVDALIATDPAARIQTADEVFDALNEPALRPRSSAMRTLGMRVRQARAGSAG